MNLSAVFQILALYAALLGLVFVGLAILTIRARQRANQALGSGDDPTLLKRSRAHGNFAEYVPLSLILIGGAIVTGAGAIFVHACGIGLLAGRLIHARALYAESIRLRVIGMVATFTVIVAACIRILVGVAA